MILKFWILPTGLLPDKVKMPHEATFLKSFIVSLYHHMDNVWHLASFRPVRPQLTLTARPANYVASNIIWWLFSFNMILWVFSRYFTCEDNASLCSSSWRTRRFLNFKISHIHSGNSLDLEHDSLDIIRLIIRFLKTAKHNTWKESVKEDAVGNKETSDFRLVWNHRHRSFPSTPKNTALKLGLLPLWMSLPGLVLASGWH